MSLARWIAFGVIALVCFGVLACGAPDPAPGDAAVSPSPTAAAPTTATPTPAEPAPAAAAEPYDSTENMYRLFSATMQGGDSTLRALELARENSDKSLVPVVLEMMRFLGSSALVLEALAFLEQVTGQGTDTGVLEWKAWMEWYGRNREEYRPPEGYVDWKAGLLGGIDPRFRGFLLPHGRDAKIDLTEVMWGGVRPDGIPDLQSAPVLTPAEAAYLQPDDSVFGVSINGEHRAYPLRIVNAHEMANDVLGGEPIALAY